MLNKRYGGLADQRARYHNLDHLERQNIGLTSYESGDRVQFAGSVSTPETRRKGYFKAPILRSILGRLLILLSTVFNSTLLTTVICRRQIPTTNFISRSTVSSHTNRESEIQQTRVFASSNVTSRNAK